MDKNFFINNRLKLKSKVSNNSIVVLFSGNAKQKNSDTFFPFSPDRNFYYMTGIDIENTIYLAFKTENKYDEYLFVERPNEKQIKYFGPMLDDKGYMDLTEIKNVNYIDEFNKIFGRINYNDQINTLYLDSSKYGFDRYLNTVNIFANDVKNSYPHIVIKNIFNEIFQMRIIKSLEEKAVIQTAIDITQKGIENILKNIDVGIGENELQAYFEFALKCSKSSGNGFYPIIASGENSLALHYEKNNRIMQKDDLVLLDLGAEYMYYSADISRTFPTGRKFTPKQKYYYEAVLESQYEAISIMKPGIEMTQTREVANKVLAKYLIKDKIITDEKDVVKYLTHGICHCIGLDVHEGDSMIMKEGMILTCEPGIYMKEYGFGIRIEDDIYITEKGHETMSSSIIKEVKDIESFTKNIK